MKSAALFANGSDSSGWIPFELFGGTRLFLPATINGVATKVMLDSGASSTVIDGTFAGQLGLRPEGTVTGQGVGGSADVSKLNGVTVQLGTLTLSSQNMVAADLTPLQQHLGHALPVILGNEVFQNTIVDIDFEQQRICFRNAATFQPPASAQAVASEVMDDLHVIHASVEGRKALLEFDLGNGLPLALYSRFWEQKGFMSGRRTSTAMTGGFGGRHVQQIAMVRSTNVGGTDFHVVPTIFEGATSPTAALGKLDGNLGMPVLSRFHLIVDFPHDRVLFAPPINTAKPFEVNRTGLTLTPTAAGAKILYVAPQSPGITAELKADDVIVAVDGKSLTTQEASGATLGSWRFGVPGETHLLLLADGHTRKLILAPYF